MLVAQAPLLRAASHFWYGPYTLGSGDGSSAGNARAFTAAHLNSLLGDDDPLELHVHFLADENPGNGQLQVAIYQVTETISPTREVDRSSLKLRFIGEPPANNPNPIRPWHVVLENRIPPQNQSYPGGHDYVLEVTGVAEVRIENLTFDGNWQWKLDALADPGKITHPSLAQAYKNQPVNLDAPCGRVANVIVRNYGAIGRLPYHRFAGFGGTECFPLVVGGDDIGQIPPAGQRRPWVVEDVEIHGFHGDYHGYTTALMAHARVTAATPSWAVADPNRRIVTVQRVQIRHDGLGTRTHGEVIGFGNAANGNAFESGRTTFADNALLNTAIGYNGDTGELRHVDLINNVLLNSAIGWRIETQIPGWMDHFDLSGNTLRLGPIASYPIYRSYCWNAQGETYTNPALVLGRTLTNSLITGAFIGNADHITFNNNWITTPQQLRFDETNPGGTTGEWSPFHKSPTIPASCEHRLATYVDGNSFTLTGNRLSTVAWDVANPTVITGGTFASFGPTTLPDLQNGRPALSALPPAGFNPTGRVERVLLETEPRSVTYSWKTGPSQTTSFPVTDHKLTGATELVIGTPTLNGNQLTVPVRLVTQKTPLDGNATTVPFASGAKVWLKVAGHTSFSGSTTTGANGIATFNLTVSTAPHGLLNLTACYDPAQPASLPTDDYEMAIATAQYPVGSVVWMTASPDVAVDRRVGGVQTGSVRLHRSGNLSGSLTVGILPESSGSGYATLYSHYQLSAVAPATRQFPAGGNWPTQPTLVTFAAGSATADLTVAPIADEVIERHVVWWKLSSPVNGNYALGHRQRASVAIHDGPEWTLHEIAHNGTPYPTTKVFAFNNELNSSQQPNPVIAGEAMITHYNAYGQPVYGLAGSWWQGSLGSVQGFFTTTPPADQASRALSVAEPFPGSNFKHFVGYKNQANGRPRAIRMSRPGGINAYLPVPTGWYTYDSMAQAISPDRNWIGGYATCWTNSGGQFTYEQRPVFWTWTGSAMTPLNNVSPPYDVLGHAETLAVNNAGEFVGWTSDETFVQHGFRSRSQGATLGTGDVLWAPLQYFVPNNQSPTNQVPDELLDSMASDITAHVSMNESHHLSGEAAGWARRFLSTGNLITPTRWLRRTDTQQNPRGTFMETRSGYPTAGVTSLNESSQFAGWVGNASGNNRVAAFWPSHWESPVTLTDAYLIHGFDAGWHLSEAVDIHDSGWIIGNGTKGGDARGWLLVRQATQ